MKHGINHCTCCPLFYKCNGNVRNVLSKRIIFIFIILQQKTIIRVGDGDDVQSEEDLIDVKSLEVYVPSAFSIEKTEPEVSVVF
jgi:hypothetical protein